MSGRKMFFGLFDKKQLSVMQQNDDIGLVRPEGAASSQPGATPWVCGQHTNALNGQKHCYVDNAFALTGRTTSILCTQGAAPG